MNKKLLLASLTLIAIFSSCEKEAIEFPSEEDAVETTQAKNTNELNKGAANHFKDNAPEDSWKLIKIVDRSGNDVTTSCNRNDYLLFKNDTEFSETRYLLKNRSCDKVGTFNFTAFVKDGKNFFTKPGDDKLQGTYELKGNNLVVTYFDTIITETTVTYSK